MPDNQLLVPEKHSEEAQELVQQILDNPNELGPAVQVRFAKRVGRPGASRVMMMDAQTVGPAGEEHEDSESKLALRLADGTNVQLSLSFFTDNQPALASSGSGGGGARRATYSPFNSYVYEPRSYNVNERGSKLPGIMIGMAFVLGAASYGVLYLTGKVADHDHALNKITKPAPIAVTKPAPVKAIKPVAPTTSGKTEKDSSPATATTESPNNNKMSKKISAYSPKVTHSSHAKVGGHTAHSENFTGGGFGFVPPPPPTSFSAPPVGKGFVPPPPPTPYMIPTGIPLPIDPLAALAPASAHTKGLYSGPKHKAESANYIAPTQTQPFQVQQIAPTPTPAQAAPEKSSSPQLGDGFDIP
ncbi:MAG TPA: hypothetical protein V6C76_09930 [Drouetiella sp.]